MMMIIIIPDFLLFMVALVEHLGGKEGITILQQGKETLLFVRAV